MYQSRLVEVFRILDKKDLRALEKFVHSPFFNQRQDVNELFNYLRKLHPFNSDKGLGREEVFREVFPGQKYDEKQLGYVFSFLFKTVKKYLAYQELAEDEVQHQTQLCIALRKRGAKRIFESEMKLAEKMLKSQPLRNPDFHFSEYQISLEKYQINIGHSRNQTEIFQELSNRFAYYFIANRLRISSAALSYRTIFQSDSQQLLLDDILRHVEENDYSHVPAISIYYHTYKALTEKNSEPYFYKLRELIKAHHHCFTKQEARDIYVLTINYCIRQIHGSNNEYLNVLFDIYKEGLANEVFVNNGIISRFTYKNIALTGLRMKEYNWVEQFLIDYKDKLEAQYRESTFNYNLAILYYRKPDYTKAMKLLQQSDFDDSLLNLNARQMLLTIYYSEKEYDALHSHLDSFKNYIYRHKELGYHRNFNLNLIRFTRKLLQLNSFDHAAIASLREEIQSTKEVAEKSWLLEQLDDI